MPQNEYIEEHIRRHGRRLDHEERMRKREARGAHRASAIAQKTTGLKAKMLNKKRRAEKVQMKKTLKQHEERDVKKAAPPSDPDTALPAYLLDREGQKDAKALSSAVKERRKDKAAGMPCRCRRCAALRTTRRSRWSRRARGSRRAGSGW